MYEKWYCMIAIIVVIVKTMFMFYPRSPSSLNQPHNKGLGPQPQCIYNFIRSGQELGQRANHCEPLRRLIQSPGLRT